MRMIDRTREAMGWNNPWQTRRANQIKRIVVHHSATAGGNMSVFENHWRSLGWRNGGYAEIILPNGDVEICYPPTTVTNGAGVWNKTSYHICVVGNFRVNGAQPTVAQMRSLLARLQNNMNRFDIPVSKVKGHKELMPTICPGMNMTNLRHQARQTPVQTPPAQSQPATPPASNASTHTVRSGETLSGIAEQHRTTVAELQRLNNIANANLIRIGQVLRLPGASNTTAALQIRVGGRVRVNTGASTWVTGQTIPAWVRGQTYTVQQLRNNNREALLAGVMSWVRTSDVTVL